MENMRAQIRIANERINSSLQSAGIGTWNFNAADNTITLDKLAQEFYGVEGSASFPYEQTLKNIHPDDVREVYQSVTDCLIAENNHQCDIQFRVFNAANEIRWLQCTGRADFNDDKTVRHFDGIIRDITKEVAGREEQRKLQIQKDNFLSIASHELKTPVTSIKAYAQLLEKMLKREGETQKADMMTRLTGQVNRLTTLLEDLLDVSKITNQKLNFKRDYHVVNEIITENVNDLDGTDSTHRIETDLGFMGSIYCDRTRISQVLKNLLSNAIKYSPEKDRVIISTKQQGSDLLVCVQDFGIGISEENKGRVFEQFYRVSTAEAYSYQGMGLGLFISAEIIRQEGGQIWIESEENKGSTFCFSLPLATIARQ